MPLSFIAKYDPAGAQQKHSSGTECISTKIYLRRRTATARNHSGGAFHAKLIESVALTAMTLPNPASLPTGSVDQGNMVSQVGPQSQRRRRTRFHAGSWMKLDIEHFGFQDKVSQPLMIQQDIAREIAGGGTRTGIPVQARRGLGGYGSFMVFRKLAQNVKAFWETLEKASKESGLGIEQLGAMAVGRLRDGTPAVPTTTIDPSADPNDFHYDQDPAGAKCPAVVFYALRHQTPLSLVDWERSVATNTRSGGRRSAHAVTIEASARTGAARQMTKAAVSKCSSRIVVPRFKLVFPPGADGADSQIEG
jgi:hypothetical protein